MSLQFSSEDGNPNERQQDRHNPEYGRQQLARTGKVRVWAKPDFPLTIESDCKANNTQLRHNQYCRMQFEKNARNGQRYDRETNTGMCTCTPSYKRQRTDKGDARKEIKQNFVEHAGLDFPFPNRLERKNQFVLRSLEDVFVKI